MNEIIVIGMPLKNNRETLCSAAESVLAQKGMKRNLILLIANDSSEDNSLESIKHLRDNKSIKIVDVNLGKAYAVRNFIHQYVRENIPNCCLLGRLDADDTLANDYVMSQVEKLWEHKQFDVLMMGNKQRIAGIVQEWINRADLRMIEKDYLLERLKAMSEGDGKAELPSCNIFVRPNIDIAYPEINSGEDHWYTVLLLLEARKLKIHLAEELIYSIYSLDGAVTKQNLENDSYFTSRKDLYEYYKQRS
jgi:glycosyltransferase involved in cell wall biosynthesis